MTVTNDETDRGAAVMEYDDEAARELLPPQQTGWSRPAAASVLAIVIALLAGAVLLAIAGINPGSAYLALVEGAVASPGAIPLLFIEAIPLLVIALGLCVAYRARVWNIGAEGQFQLGALAATAFLLLVPVPSGIIAIAAALAVAAAAGGALAALIGLLRARWGINEVVTSLLSNYVVFFAVAYVVRQPLSDPAGFNALQSTRIPDNAVLPILSFPSGVHAGLLIAIALVPIVGWTLGRTPFGTQIRAVGLNAEAAEAAGIPTRRLIVQAAAISGVFAGLAGAIQLTGSELRLTTSIASGVGFTAIVVALLGRLTVIGTVLASLLIAGLSSGGDYMQIREGVPNAVVVAIEAMIVLFVLLANRLGATHRVRL